MFNNKRRIQQDVCYAMIKWDNIYKQMYCEWDKVIYSCIVSNLEKFVIRNVYDVCCLESMKNEKEYDLIQMW